MHFTKSIWAIRNDIDRSNEPSDFQKKFCHSLWRRKRLKKHTTFSQWMTVERRGKLRSVFVKKRD